MILFQIYEMNIGNLVAQQNKVNILKLLYNHELGLPQRMKTIRLSLNHLNLKMLLLILIQETNQIIHSIKESDAHYGPLLVWIISKIVNNSGGKTNKSKSRF